ncbi:MAG: 50S ribosomal protein L39e [Candidatus Altiarchaeota archaeon]|nr:50S ribosomal protein L39e [Candidatus Altiarchaeota archaeon]
MARNKDQAKKAILVKADRTSKRAPVWVYAKTNRKVRDSPKSSRNWRTRKLF